MFRRPRQPAPHGSACALCDLTPIAVTPIAASGLFNSQAKTPVC